MTGAQAEGDPSNNWRIERQGPLSWRTYQRHGTVLWALVVQNRDFA